MPNSVMIHAENNLVQVKLDRVVCADYNLAVLRIDVKGCDCAIFLNAEAERQLREALGPAIPEAEPMEVVNHKDGDPANNEISNLEVQASAEFQKLQKDTDSFLTAVNKETRRW